MAICFAIGDKIYYGSGLGSNSSGYIVVDDFWMFDSASDTWTQRASFPNGGIYGCVSFAIGGKGYVATGSSSGAGATNNLWEYDPVADSWAMKAPLPSSSRHNARGFSIGAFGYVVAGMNGTTPLSEVWRYYPSSDSWLQKNPFGGTPGEQRFSFIIGTDAYIGGQGTMGQLWKYDADNDSWLQRANQPNGEAWGVAFGHGGAGYVVNGMQSYMYAPANDLWSPVSGPSSSVFGWTGAVSVGGSGYVVAGDEDSSVWELTGTGAGLGDGLGTTTRLSVLPNPTAGSFVLQSPLHVRTRSLSLLDATGRLVLSQPIVNSSSSITVDLSDHDNGLYFVQVLFADGTLVVERVVKE